MYVFYKINVKGVLFGCLVLWIINTAINVPIFVEHVYTPPAIDNSTLTSSTVALALACGISTHCNSFTATISCAINRNLETPENTGGIR